MRAPAWLRSGWTLVVAFLLSRAWMIGIWRTDFTYIIGDVGYYFTKVQALPQAGIGATMTEYPTPVVWLLAAMGLVGDSYVTYAYVFGITMLALDALFALLLWHHTGAGRWWSTAYWVAFVPLMGPLLYFRFDLLPAVLAGAGLLYLARRPRLAGALVGLGAATKLWPALLVVPMLARRKSRAQVATGFLAVGGGLGVASLLFSGWARTTSPLTWQSARGLQVESLVATPLMWQRTFGERDLWRVWLSDFNAFEIQGPGEQLALQASTVLTVLGMATIALLCWRALTRRANRRAIGLTMLAIVAIMIVTNKTLSPQYVVWLAGPLAVLVGMVAENERGALRPAPRVLDLAIASLPLAGLTQLVYPVLYDGLVNHPHGTPGSVAVLVARNALIAVWTVYLCVAAWQSTTAPRHVLGGADNPVETG